MLIEIDRLHAASLSPRETLGHSVNGYDLIAQVDGNPSRHVTDRESQHRHRAAGGDVGVGDGLPGRRQDVAEIDKPRVRWPFRDLDVGELGLRLAEQLGLTAGNLAVEIGVADSAAPICRGCVFSHWVNSC